MAKLIHRDDLPMETAEEIVTHLQAMYPGMTVQFAGDKPNPELDEKLNRLNEYFDRKLAEGRCLDCDRQMENWPGVENMPDDWKPPKGWGTFHQVGSDEMTGWQCPECDAIEEAEQHE